MKKIGVFTSGGDAPGMNACIRSVVRTAHHHNVEVIGIQEGYKGMLNNDFKTLSNFDVSNIINKGGTILGSSRCLEFMTISGRKKAYDHLQEQGIEGLVAIGGNGTFTGALVFEQEFGIPTIGVPGTIDNDLYGTDFTIGFDTACNTVIDAIDRIRETAASHKRLFFIEVMGRDAGYIALKTCIAGGAEAVLLPEDKEDLHLLMDYLAANSKKKMHANIVIVAEGDEMGGAVEINKLVRKNYPEYDTRVTILGHVQRGGTPTCSDRVLASRLGMHAVEGLIAGNKNVMVGVVNDVVQQTSFKNSIEKNKTLNQDLIKMSKILVA